MIHGVINLIGNANDHEDMITIKVLHAQEILQLQSFHYDPKYIDLYHVNTNLPQ